MENGRWIPAFAGMTYGEVEMAYGGVGRYFTPQKWLFFD